MYARNTGHIYAQVRRWAIILSIYTTVSQVIGPWIFLATRAISLLPPHHPHSPPFFLLTPSLRRRRLLWGSFAASSPPRLLFCLPSRCEYSNNSFSSSLPVSHSVSLSLSPSFFFFFIFFDLQLVSDRCTSNGLVNWKWYDLPELWWTVSSGSIACPPRRFDKF